jgi:hypothetical protein
MAIVGPIIVLAIASSSGLPPGCSMPTLDQRWTRAELDKADRLQRSGVSCRAIAERLGRPLGSLKTQLCRYRKGKLDRMLTRQDRDAILLRMAEEGRPAREIHEALNDGTCVQNTWMKLRSRGFDAEVMREIREGI